MENTHTGYTGRYEHAGVVHRGEFIIPKYYAYPKWTRCIPRWLGGRLVRRVFRKEYPALEALRLQMLLNTTVD